MYSLNISAAGGVRDFGLSAFNWCKIQILIYFCKGGGKKRDKSAVLKPYSLYTVKSIEMYEFLLQRLDLLQNIRVGNYQTQFVQFCLKGS